MDITEQQQQIVQNGGDPSDAESDPPLLEQLKEEIRERMLEVVNGVGGESAAGGRTSIPLAATPQILKKKVETMVGDLKWFQTYLREKVDATDPGEDDEKAANQKEINEFFEYSLIDQINMLSCQVDWLVKQHADALAKEGEDNQDAVNQKKLEAENGKKMINSLLKELFNSDLISFRGVATNLEESLLKDCLVEWELREDKLQIGVNNQVQQVSSQQPVLNAPNMEYYLASQRRYRARNLYEQEKYNLLREQNEGYAKLIVLLDQVKIEQLPEKNEFLDKAIKDIVNHFNVDPNRVVDVLLESFENHLGSLVKDIRSAEHASWNQIRPHYVLDDPSIDLLEETFLALIKTWLPAESTREYIMSAILGFKVQHYLNTTDFENIDFSLNPKDVIPYNLILLVALLIRDDHIKLEKIMPYFVQKQKKVSEMKPADSSQGAPGEPVPLQSQPSQGTNQQHPQRIEFIDKVPDDIVHYHSLYTEYLNRVYSHIDVNFLDQGAKEKEKAKLAEWREKMRELCRKKMPYNYQLWLVTCLLQLNDLEDADLLISTLWGERKLDLTIHRDLLCTLLELIEVMIRKLHPNSLQANQNSKSTWFKVKKAKEDLRTLKQNAKGVKLCEAPEELVIFLPRIMKLIGVYVCQNHAIYKQLLQTVSYHLVENCPNGAYHAQAFYLAGEYFLPALCINNDQNYELDDLLWSIFSKMDSHRRYHYYYQLMSHGYLANHQLLDRFTQIYPKAKQWTKHICSEQNKIQEQKLQAMKIANGGNTLILAQQILFMCKNCSNLIEPIIQSIERALRDLGLDMMAFVLLRHLSEKQDIFKQIDSEGNLPQECTIYISLASLFFKTFQWVEIRPLFTYVLNRLRDGDNTSEAFILSGILTAMSGWKDLESTLLNTRQLQCLAGGIKLKIDMMEMSQEFKKSKQRKYTNPAALSHQKWSTADALINLLYDVPREALNGEDQDFSLAFSLMANLAQQAHFVVDIMECDDMLRLQSIFDKTHQLFRQFVDTVYFLKEDNLKFKQLIPEQDHCIELLSRTYRIPFQYSFYIIRHSFKQLYDMKDAEFQSMVKIYSGIFDETLKIKKELCQDDQKPEAQEGQDNDWDDWDDYPYFDETKYLNAKFNDSLWTNFTREIFTIFWKLELQDIQLPEQIYEEQIEQKELKRQQLQTGAAHTSGGPNDKQNTEQAKKMKKDVDGLVRMKSELKEELDQCQRVRYEKTMAWLKEKMWSLFNQIENQWGVSSFFTQYCLQPRIMFSPADAVYSIRFLKVLVDLRVPKINVLNIFAQIMKAIIHTIHCCSLDESENLGIFFMEWFQLIDRWTGGNGEVWKKECADYTGFSKKVGSSDLDSIINLEGYMERIVNQIHLRFSSFMIRYFLTNPKNQFMKTKCALKILNRIRAVFPRDQQIAQEILTSVKQIVQMHGIQQDILTLAMRYHQELSDKLPELDCKGQATQRNAQPTPGGGSGGDPSAGANNNTPGQSRQKDQQSQAKQHQQGRQGDVSPGSNVKNTQPGRQQPAHPREGGGRLGQKRYHEESANQGKQSKHADAQGQDHGGANSDSEANHAKRGGGGHAHAADHANKSDNELRVEQSSKRQRVHERSISPRQGGGGNHQHQQFHNPKGSPNRQVVQNRKMSNQGPALKEQEGSSRGRLRLPQQASSRQQHHESSYNQHQNRQQSPVQKRGGGASPNRNPNAVLSGGSRAGIEKERGRERGDTGATGQRRGGGVQQWKAQDHQDTHHGHKPSPHNSNGSNHQYLDQRMQSRSQSPRRHNQRNENAAGGGAEKPALISSSQYQNNQRQEKRNDGNGAYFDNRGGTQQKQSAKDVVEPTQFKRQKLIQIPSKAQNIAGQDGYSSQQQQDDNQLRIKRDNRFAEHQGLQKQGNQKLGGGGLDRGGNTNQHDSQGQRQIVNPRSSPKYGRQNDHHLNRSPPQQHYRKSRSPSQQKQGNQHGQGSNQQRRQGAGPADNQQHSQEAKAYSQGSRRSGTPGRHQPDRRGGRQMMTGGGAHQDQMQHYGGSGDKMNQQRGGNQVSKRQHQRDHPQQEMDQVAEMPNDSRQRQLPQRDLRDQRSPHDYRQHGMAGKGGQMQGRKQNLNMVRSNRGGPGGNDGFAAGQDGSYGKSHTVSKQQYYQQHGSGGSDKDLEYEPEYEQYQQTRGHGGSKTQQKRDYAPNYPGPSNQGGGGQPYSSSRHQGNWPGGGPKHRKQDGGQQHQSGYNRGQGGRGGGFNKKDQFK